MVRSRRVIFKAHLLLRFLLSAIPMASASHQALLNGFGRMAPNSEVWQHHYESDRTIFIPPTRAADPATVSNEAQYEKAS
jgi:hypothetical protein